VITQRPGASPYGSLSAGLGGFCAGQRDFYLLRSTSLRSLTNVLVASQRKTWEAKHQVPTAKTSVRRLTQNLSCSAKNSRTQRTKLDAGLASLFVLFPICECGWFSEEGDGVSRIFMVTVCVLDWWRRSHVGWAKHTQRRPGLRPQINVSRSRPISFLDSPNTTGSSSKLQ